MKLYINDILYAFSYALDCIESELVGITSHHGKRVAYICLLLGEGLGLNTMQLNDLAACAILHDNALTEYIHEESINGVDVRRDKTKINVGLHCVLGEENLKKFPFNGDVSGAILYHHENADGSGPLGKTWLETPIYAQLIHLADSIDVQFGLNDLTEEKFDKILEYLNEYKNVKYHESVVELFEQSVDNTSILRASDLNIKSALDEKFPVIYKDYTLEEFVSFVDVIANVIDYKSEFTMRHSMGIAKKAAKMARYYNYDEETIAKLYVAGAVHDIGKLVIDKDVLEKPNKLTETEYIYMKNHAYYTYEILKGIRGFEDICSWASMHHEKLNGKGYPFGKTAEQLGFKERLMACLDIYQALTETRPYKHGFAHEKSIKIMKDMAKNNFIDGSIVEDLIKVFN